MTNKTMRIVIFNWRDPWDTFSGGAERVTLKHAEVWVKSGHTVTWVSGTYPGARADEKKNGIRFLRVGSSKTLFLRAWYIFRTTLRGEADLIIDEVHGLPMFAPLWSGKTKVICFIHELANEIWKEMFSFPISTIGLFIERHVFPRAYKNVPFWVDCQSTKEDLVRISIPANHIHIIPCAIDPLPVITPQKKESKLTCIFVARLVKMKGIEFALQTFAEILKKEPTAQFWIVGGGETDYVEKLKGIVKELKIDTHTQFFGLVSEKQKFELIARAHVLLHTSIKEGFGLTVLEANSQHTIASVFHVAALKDLVDSEKGIIVPFSETQQLADEIVKLYHDSARYAKLQHTAFEFSKQFRWDRFTKQSENLLRTV